MQRTTVSLTCLIILMATVTGATTSVRTDVRLAPGDVWCPTGLTFGELRPSLQSSTQSVFDRGDFETSFRSPPNGLVYVTLQATATVRIDNILAVPRNYYFSPGGDWFDSDACHRDADPSYPRVRVHAFDPSALPAGAWLQRFAMSDPSELENQGWSLGNAILDPSSSAVELLPAGDQAAVTTDCPGAASTCPTGTGSLILGPGDRVRFPMGLAANADFVLQLWWKGPIGARLDVRVDDYSACPEAPTGVFIDHNAQLEIEILDAQLERGIDPELPPLIPFIEDQSDTFGILTVDGASSDIPQIDNDDNPHWEGAARYSFGDLSDPSAVAVKIEMYDNDEFDNAHVDLDANPTDRDLDLTVDMCRMQVEGDLSADLGGVLEAVGDPGSGDDRGRLRFRIANPSGRPLTTDDLAVVDVDFVQVVHRTRFAVTEKPGVVMVSVANNYSTSIATEVLVEVYGPGGYFVSRRFPVTLDAESAKTFYFFDDAPIYPPSPTPGVPSYLGLNVHIDPDGMYSGGLPFDDCRIDNDLVSERFWKLVETDPLVLSWCKVGRVLDLSGLVSDPKYSEVKTLGTDFIRAVYPTASVSSFDCPIPLTMTPTFGAVDFITTVLDTFEIPFSSVIPFALVWDMNISASITGIDKMMGVLPYADWYTQFEGWQTVNGNSLGEAAPHAVIFLPELKDDDGNTHVKVTLPGHELAHTFGVSADPRLKDTTSCGIDYPPLPGIPPIGDLICGATGGLDEYKASDPARVKGNPATGYWVALGTEDPRIATFAGQKQCDRSCFMGFAAENQLEDWQQNGRWIDVNDYELLIDRLGHHPDPEVLFVSGMIDADDNSYLGPWLRLPAGVPDRVDGDDGGYRVRFYDANDDLLQDVGFPVAFGASHTEVTPPITFFAFSVPWALDTARIDLVRNPHDQALPPVTIESRLVSQNPPTVTILAPQGGTTAPPGGTVDLQWAANDVDGDPLMATVLGSVDGDTWSVVHGWLENGETTASVPSDLLPAGEVQLKVLVTDGVHSAESGPVAVEALGPGWLFGDGFEGGTTGAWSATTGG